MEVITQTNRTMLFEEINPEKLNLLTLVGDAKELEINGWWFASDKGVFAE